MKPNYCDVLAAALASGKQPLWFDENGVPRYVEFHPDRCATLGADESFLVEIRCQGCGTAFLVALTWKMRDIEREMLELPPLPRLTVGNSRPNASLAYGDPPNIGCCPAGHTMSSELHRLQEAWVRTGATWRKLDADETAALPVHSEVDSWG